MKQYTITWRGDGDEFIVTGVEIADHCDPFSLSTDEWVDLAWQQENRAAGLCKDEWGERPSEVGYDLISVVEGVPNFIY